MSGGTRLRATAGGSVTLVADDTLTTDEVQVFPAVAVGVGVNQTWQDMTASRAVGTEYTNTTGSPIVVQILSGGIDVRTTILGTMTIDGTAVVFASSGSYEWGRVIGNIVIPIGATYSLSFSTARTLSSWFELR